ncbi:MAG: phenylacetate--CoA ligase family protein [Actinobacteria bacterium]|nr:phenylacetate--CoA ligase family protein [Actinomycetota bacterium]
MVDRHLWNPDRESVQGDALRELQAGRLRQQLSYLRGRSGFYRERIDGAGVRPQDITSLEDIHPIPCFTKYQHREVQEASLSELGHPYGTHLCAPLDQVIGVQATSGTSGLPTFYTFSKHDYDVNDEVIARTLWRLGLRPGDGVMLGFALSMFVGGAPWIGGMQKMGLRVIPIGAEGGTGRLLQFAQLTKPRALLCTPSFAEYLAERAPELIGADVSSLGIEILMCGGEPGAGDPAVRARLEVAYGAEVYDGMGGAWGFFMVSCREHQGMHIVSPDLALVEAIDPETGAAVEAKDGTIAEMAFTSLDWEAGPILRYNMGDVAEFLTAPCSCGLPGSRYRILGRADDMLIVKGINVYPAAVRDVVAELAPRVTGAMRIVLDQEGPKVPSPLLLRIEHREGLEEAECAALSEQLEQRIRDLLRFRPTIELLPPGSLERSAHKTKLIVKRYAGEE